MDCNTNVTGKSSGCVPKNKYVYLPIFCRTCRPMPGLAYRDGDGNDGGSHWCSGCKRKNPNFRLIHKIFFFLFFFNFFCLFYFVFFFLLVISFQIMSRISPVTCIFLSVLFQYFCLTNFCWMLVEGKQLFVLSNYLKPHAF